MSKDLKTWVEALVAREGTVLHLAAGRVPLARVDGSLEPIGTQALDTQTFVQTVHAVCGENDAGVLHAAAAGGQMLHGRVVSDAGRRTLVIRRLVSPETDRAKIGLPDVVWDTVAGLQSGLVLITGEHDSGLSTTCAALAAARTADAGVHALLTGEPLTWRLGGDAHRARLSYLIDGVDAEHLAKSLNELRERDVDLICCDPVASPWSFARLASAAADGALVIASVRGSGAPEALRRLTDLTVDGTARNGVRHEVAASLRLVIHQALVDRADGDGRVLACGVLLQTPAVYNLIREDRAHQLAAMMAVGGKLGMRTLDQHLEDLVKAGTVTREAAIAAHPHPWALESWLDRSAPAQPGPPPAQP